MADYIEMIKGEAKTWEFTIVDASSSAVALSTATMTLTVKKESVASANITKNHALFSMGSAASGIAKINIGAASTTSMNAGYYTCQLTTQLSATNIDKYKFNLDLRESLA